jgi:hypothetical protein
MDGYVTAGAKRGGNKEAFMAPVPVVSLPSLSRIGMTIAFCVMLCDLSSKSFIRIFDSMFVESLYSAFLNNKMPQIRRQLFQLLLI